MKTQSKSLLAVIAGAFVLLCAPALRSQTLTFNVDIMTAGLSADSAGAPFYLDFQMDYGNASLASNSVTLSNFTFTGGTALGSAVTDGSATGSLTSSAVLTASSAHPVNELYQAFSSGVTDIQFKAVVTETGPDVGTPTEFTAAIFDSTTGGPAQLFTTAPDTESLVTLNVSASDTLGSIGAFSATSSADGNTPLTGVTATVIPEPSTTAAIFGCAALVAAFLARRYGLLRAA